jgi:hypothetical protein
MKSHALVMPACVGYSQMSRNVDSREQHDGIHDLEHDGSERTAHHESPLVCLTSNIVV